MVRIINLQNLAIYTILVGCEYSTKDWQSKMLTMDVSVLIGGEWISKCEMLTMDVSVLIGCEWISKCEMLTMDVSVLIACEWISKCEMLTMDVSVLIACEWISKCEMLTIDPCISKGGLNIWNSELKCQHIFLTGCEWPQLFPSDVTIIFRL